MLSLFARSFLPPFACCHSSSPALLTLSGVHHHTTTARPPSSDNDDDNDDDDGIIESSKLAYTSEYELDRRPSHASHSPPSPSSTIASLVADLSILRHTFGTPSTFILLHIGRYLLLPRPNNAKCRLARHRPINWVAASGRPSATRWTHGHVVSRPRQPDATAGDPWSAPALHSRCLPPMLHRLPPPRSAATAEARLSGPFRSSPAGRCSGRRQHPSCTLPRPRCTLLLASASHPTTCAAAARPAASCSSG